MGKGDPRTKRGKIFRHSYGKFRAKKSDSSILVEKSKDAEVIVEQQVSEIQEVVNVEVQETEKPKKAAVKKSPAKKSPAKKADEIAE